VVPKGGVQLPDGPYLAEDTIVGINPWVLHLNTKIYGTDANHFRPERWLPNDGEDSDEFAARRKAMRDTDMTFGAGDRACLGKQVAMVEIYKLIATLFLLFEVRNQRESLFFLEHCDLLTTLISLQLEWADPNKDWKVINSWFVRQEGIEMKLRRRR